MKNKTLSIRISDEDILMLKEMSQYYKRNKSDLLTVLIANQYQLMIKDQRENNYPEFSLKL